jgi:cell division protein FtsZ
VVVGTVIDPEMHDELRVTIVVTGLANVHEGGRRSLRDERLGRQLGQGSKRSMVDPNQEADYLDIPTFLRRQSD